MPLVCTRWPLSRTAKELRLHETLLLGEGRCGRLKRVLALLLLQLSGSGTLLGGGCEGE